MAKCHGAYYDGVLRIICASSPEVVLIAGEIDQAHYLGLVSTLEDLVDPEGDVRVNLAELAYCDLAGLRAILRLARTGREDQGRSGRSLFLDDVPPHLATVLQILGWDSTSGLIMTLPDENPSQGARSASTSSIRSSAAAIQGSVTGSSDSSARSRCASVSP